MDKSIRVDAAYDVDQKIHLCNYNVRANFLLMAELLARVRDEKLYVALDCPTFESYLGTLSAEGNRAWLYRLIRAYEMFSKRLGVPDARLIEVGPTKLDIISPVVTPENADEWLGKAAVLSKSDVINEVRQARGKPPLSSLPGPEVGAVNSPGLSGLTKYASYPEYVKAQPCLVCGARPVDAHHFPRGRVRTDDLNKTVPLCQGCHAEYHQDPMKWTHNYAAKWGDYFYSIIFKIWG